MGNRNRRRQPPPHGAIVPGGGQSLGNVRSSTSISNVGVTSVASSAGGSNHSLHAGPLPDPNLLKAYEEACPGLRDLIVEEWREESKHRRNADTRAMDFADKGQSAQIVSQRWGMFLGTFLGFAQIAGAVFLGFNGNTAAAIGVASTGTVTTIGVALVNMWKNRAATPKEPPPPTGL